MVGFQRRCCDRGWSEVLERKETERERERETERVREREKVGWCAITKERTFCRTGGASEQIKMAVRHCV